MSRRRVVASVATLILGAVIAACTAQAVTEPSRSSTRTPTTTTSTRARSPTRCHTASAASRPTSTSSMGVNVNWYLYWGLRQHGFADVAAELRRRTLTMVATGGIREFYDPFTALGEGASDFGWTTLVLDLANA